MSRADHKAGSTAAGAGGGQKGIAAVAGALGKFFGLFRRIRIPLPLMGRTERKQSWSSKRKAAKQHELEVEIARLEGKLDEIYAQIVQGAGSLKRDELPSETLDLQSLIEMTRDLKSQLREKRAVLSRSKRDEARWTRLVQTGWREIDSSLVKEQAAFGSPEESSRSRGAGASDKVRKAITRASTRSSSGNDAQQVIVNKVVEDLLEDDPEIRQSAAARLGELGSSSAQDILIATLEDPDDRVRVAALNSLALLGDDSATEIFTRFSRDADHRFRIAALRGLSRMEGAESNLRLIGGLEDEQPSVRKAAATYLGWRQDKTAVKALMRALRDDDEDVRSAAASSLGNIGDDRAVLTLIRALEDPAQVVREKAKTAIETMLGEEIDIDIQAKSGILERRIEEMKKWWRESRVDIFIEHMISPALSEKPRASRQEEEEPEEEPEKPVEPETASTPARAKLIGKPAEPEEEESPVEPAAPEGDVAADTPPASEPVQPSAPDDANEADGLDDDLDGPDGLNGLGVSVSTSGTAASEGDDGRKE